jgi:hypothetical protein
MGLVKCMIISKRLILCHDGVALHLKVLVSVSILARQAAACLSMPLHTHSIL